MKRIESASYAWLNKCMTRLLRCLVPIFNSGARNAPSWRDTRKSTAAPRFSQLWHVYKNNHIPNSLSQAFLLFWLPKHPVSALSGRPESSASFVDTLFCTPFPSAILPERPFLHALISNPQHEQHLDHFCFRLATACASYA